MVAFLLASLRYNIRTGSSFCDRDLLFSLPGLSDPSAMRQIPFFPFRPLLLVLFSSAETGVSSQLPPRTGSTLPSVIHYSHKYEITEQLGRKRNPAYIQKEPNCSSLGGPFDCHFA